MTTPDQLSPYAPNALFVIACPVCHGHVAATRSLCGQDVCCPLCANLFCVPGRARSASAESQPPLAEDWDRVIDQLTPPEPAPTAVEYPRMSYVFGAAKPAEASDETVGYTDAELPIHQASSSAPAPSSEAPPPRSEAPLPTAEAPPPFSATPEPPAATPEPPAPTSEPPAATTEAPAPVASVASEPTAIEPGPSIPGPSIEPVPAVEVTIGHEESAPVAIDSVAVVVPGDPLPVSEVPADIPLMGPSPVAPTEAELDLHEPVRTIRQGDTLVEIRRLTPEERRARRFRRNLMMIVVGVSILLAIVVIFGVPEKPPR